MKYLHDKKAPCLFVVETQCERCASGGKMNKASLSYTIQIPKINLLVSSKLYLISLPKYLLFLFFNVQIRKAHAILPCLLTGLFHSAKNFLCKIAAVNDLKV